MTFFSAPAVNIENNYSTFINQELAKSDRPELTSASIVISGGMLTHDPFILPTEFMCVSLYLQTFICVSK